MDETGKIQASWDRGAEIIRNLAKDLPNSPGVYRMLNAKGELLYVGKARSLKKRVMNYTQVERQPRRIVQMISETTEMMFVRTHTEVEALLLEANLIKRLRPRYNILLKDSKSFPYILITDGHDYPQLVKHRGARNRPGQYYGPFASAGSVNETVTTLQRAFMLRTCSDPVFAQRTRPCLQYHIKRCTAPCVDRVTREQYAEQVQQARDFMSGKSRMIQDRFVKAMEEASEALDFELAAQYRDRIRALAHVQLQQNINVTEIEDADVIAIAQREGCSCIQVFFFRGGQNFGNRAFFPKHDGDETPVDVLTAFLAQFYEDKPVPPLVLVSHVPEEKELLEQALCIREEKAHRVTITRPERGTRKRLMEFVGKNAADELVRYMVTRKGDAALLDGVAKLFELEGPPKRIEIYDNSHISGTDMVGGMVVAGPDGWIKGEYRKFNIRVADAADDYGMMREVITRRFRRIGEGTLAPGMDDWPDLVLIDGGLGQLGAVREALAELGIDDILNVVSIAKGPDRNAGREKFFIWGREMFQLPENDPVLHYLQRLRDEAHRFAIGTHRARRAKKITSSPLDGVPGIGAKRKKALLMHFGSGQAVARAGLADLEQVEGISKAVAGKIYNYFHENG